MKRILVASLMLILFVSKAPAEYTIYIFDQISNDTWYVWGGADSGGEDVYASTELRIEKGGVLQAQHYECLPYTSVNEANVALSFSTSDVFTWLTRITGTVAAINLVSGWLSADTFKPKVYFKNTGGSCSYVEACDEWDGNSSGVDEHPLCELGQGYDGFTLNYGSAPCNLHISGEYKAKRRGTGDWTCSGQEIDVESGPIECTHP